MSIIGRKIIFENSYHSIEINDYKKVLITGMVHDRYKDKKYLVEIDESNAKYLYEDDKNKNILSSYSKMFIVGAWEIKGFNDAETFPSLGKKHKNISDSNRDDKILSCLDKILKSEIINLNS